MSLPLWSLAARLRDQDYGVYGDDGAALALLTLLHDDDGVAFSPRLSYLGCTAWVPLFSYYHVVVVISHSFCLHAQ